MAGRHGGEHMAEAEAEGSHLELQAERRTNWRRQEVLKPQITPSRDVLPPARSHTTQAFPNIITNRGPRIQMLENIGENSLKLPHT